ncbi:hypothetical protein Tco_0459907 [Tanacetum coccineum]
MLVLCAGLIRDLGALELLYVEPHYSKKFEVPFIAMYMKKECQSLFKDQEHGDMENLYDFDQKPTLMWHKSVLYGMADMHDRHRDMRLDIDNMSYEELLALEERIGNVNTRLTEENISKCMKQKIYVTEDGQPLNLVVYARQDCAEKALENAETFEAS